MYYATSKDGTRIACERLGDGPPLVLVDGALCRRAFGPMAELSKLLAPHFTVVYYDRRGRDESGDTLPYHVTRESEDLASVIDSVGGSANVFGASSGAALSMRAAASGVTVTKLALHAPPNPLEDQHSELLDGYRERIDELLAVGRRGAAVALFLKVVGVPAFGRFAMRLMPNVWPKLKAVAHTLPYDFAQLGDRPGHGLPRELVSLMKSIRVPSLLLIGTKSPTLRRGVEVTASTIPGAKLQLLEGQAHNAAASAVAPVLIDYFT